MTKNFLKVQVQARPEIAQKFQDAFEQSECNTKGDFLTKLLNYWLNPEIDQENIRRIDELENTIEQLKQVHTQQIDELEHTINSHEFQQDQLYRGNENLEMEKESVKSQLLYFHQQLSPILAKHQGEVVQVKNSITKRYIKRNINRERDVFDVIMNSINIK
ncbi:MAG: hypothetical protein PF541_10420 [Prolixibacteraceae bacterium]|jgi:hypothetical protein|nr:hypothetical protein [Prolixibacteraceae bacterium]